MGERDIIFHAPNEFHRIRSIENTSPRVLNVSFRISSELPEYLKSGVMHLSFALHNEYTNIVDMLQACETQRKKNEPTDLFEVGFRMSAFFMRLMRESHAKDSFSTTAGAKTYNSIIKLMHKEIYSNLSLEELAKMSYVSVSYIKKVFRHYAGIGPKSYYTNLRVSEAKKLLLTGIPISDISEKMNFSSACYFSIFFKNQTGYTPMQYKKMNSIH